MDTIFIGGADFGSKKRQQIIKTIILLFAVIFIGRLGFLQIVRGDIYRLESETQAIKQVVVEPFRGNMFDRNGKLIVHNERENEEIKPTIDMLVNAISMILFNPILLHKAKINPNIAALVNKV